MTRCSLCRTTTNQRREDKKRKREEDERVKAELKQQQDKVKAESSAAAGTGTGGDGDGTVTQADTKSGDTPDAKKAKTNSAGTTEAASQVDLSIAAVPEGAEVSSCCAVLCCDD